VTQSHCILADLPMGQFEQLILTLIIGTAKIESVSKGDSSKP
jgi:hypothetical protein